MDTTLDLDKLIEETAAKLRLQKSSIEDSPDSSSEGSGPPADADPDVSEDKAKEDKDSGGDAPPAPPATDPAAAPDPVAADASAGLTDDGQPPSLDELVSEYSKLPDPILDLCLQAAQQAKAMKAAPVAPPVAPPIAPAPQAPAPMAPPAPAADPMMAMKSEYVKSMQDLLSTREELASAKIKNEELAKKMAKNEEILKDFLQTANQPMRKSFANSSEVKKPETFDVNKLSKAEINGMLREKLRAGKLSKSEADLVQGFAIGSKTVKDIAHLLK